MHLLSRIARATLGLVLVAAPSIAAPPSSGPLPPSAVIYSGSFRFFDGTEQYPASVTIPPDGAWLYGTSSLSGASWMDCDHHYEVDLSPGSPDYSPFLSLGYVNGIDTPCVFSNACFSCSLNWGGFKPRTDYTTSLAPGWLPGGTYQASLRSLNGGGGSSLPGDAVSLGLNQVNAVALQSMSVFEAVANDLPVQASTDEVNSRAYIVGNDDRVPLVAQFLYGIDSYPAPPSATFTATWDTGDAATIEIASPYGHPGHRVLLISIPKMKTGNHKITVTATLPSGKTYTAPAYTVFVYNAALEAVIGGSVLPAPVSFTRAQTVTFRVQQQDLKGKAIKVTKAEWIYLNPGDSTRVEGIGETTLAVDSKEWTGVMHQGGTIVVSLTLQTGKIARTSHASLTLAATAKARTGSTWTTVQNLCENCWDDLGIKNGGNLPSALVFPSWQNVKFSTAPFPANLGGGLTLGITGDRRAYENGLKDASGAYLIEPRTFTKTFPLYHPVDAINDPSEWPNRYTLSQITTGPNRGYWYVTNHTYKTEFGYAINAYFNPTSGPGSSPANYNSFVLTGAPGCTSYVAVESCYAASPLATCWAGSHGALGYYQAAAAAIDPNTNAPYNMAGVAASVRTHEKGHHWQDWLVTYVAANKVKYDIGTIMELITTRETAEATARLAIDVYVLNKVNFAYGQDPAGGANEIYNDLTPRFPLVDDTGVTNLPPCSFFY